LKRLNEKISSIQKTVDLFISGDLCLLAPLKEDLLLFPFYSERLSNLGKTTQLKWGRARI
jgi:hypothetical protein